jgi:hypothetical protein
MNITLRATDSLFASVSPFFQKTSFSLISGKVLLKILGLSVMVRTTRFCLLRKAERFASAFPVS